MKQITYNFNLNQLMESLVDHLIDMEDGYYRLSFLLETIPSIIDKLNPQQREGFYPGLITRIVGLELIRVEDPGPLTIKVLNGIVIPEEQNGFNSDNSRFVESGDSIGENSDSIGEGDSSRGRERSGPRAAIPRPRLLYSTPRR